MFRPFAKLVFVLIAVLVLCGESALLRTDESRDRSPIPRERPSPALQWKSSTKREHFSATPRRMPRAHIRWPSLPEAST